MLIFFKKKLNLEKNFTIGVFAISSNNFFPEGINFNRLNDTRYKLYVKMKIFNIAQKL